MALNVIDASPSPDISGRLEKSEDMTTPVAPKKPNEIDLVVGARIRLRRKLLRISQASLAEKLGISFQQVQKYEMGTSRIGAGRLQATAHFLHVPVSFFFRGDEEGVGESPATHDELSVFLSTPDGLELNRAFSKIVDPDIRKKLLRLVKAAAGVDAG